MTRMACLILLVLGGCYAEVTGGTYLVKDPDGLRSGFGAGASIGMFYEFGKTRVAAGSGADFVHRQTPATESWNAGGGFVARVDAPTAANAPHTTVAFGFGAGGVGVRPRGGDGDWTSDPDATGWSLFVGESVGIQGGDLGVRVSLGTNVVRTQSEMAGDMWAAGPQVRITLSGVLSGLVTLMSNSNYKSEPFDLGEFFHRTKHCRYVGMREKCV